MAVGKLDVVEQFFDNSGNPLAGGLLYIYAGGTTTPLAVYTDATGNTAHANPIVLDSAGRPPGDGLWYTEGVAVKVVVKDSSSVTLDTIDNVVAPVSGATTGSQYADPYFFYAGGPPATNELILSIPITRAMTFAANLSGSFGDCITAPTASFTISVRKNATAYNTGTQIGTVAIATNKTFTFTTTSGATQSLSAGDKLSFWCPTTTDASIAYFGATLAGALQ